MIEGDKYWGETKQNKGLVYESSVFPQRTLCWVALGQSEGVWGHVQPDPLGFICMFVFFQLEMDQSGAL